MTSITDGAVKIQTTSESHYSTPAWFGEAVVISRYLQKHKVLNLISEQVRIARKRFGQYEVIGFLAVLFGYAISGERTLEEFYERLQPFAVPFMALFERDQLPARSTLSRFLAALSEEPVEALRTLFLNDLLARPLTPDKQAGGLVDRTGDTWTVFDIDGTREAARQRALPQTDELPPPVAGWMTSVRLVTEAANAERLFGREQPFLRPITTPGSARLGTAGMGAIGKNCAKDSRPLAAIWRRIASTLRARCSGSMGNMAMGPCSPISLGSRL